MNQHVFVRRRRTSDRGPPHPEELAPSPGDGPPLSQLATILTVEQLGPKRELTSQGYLLCRDVPIARTGTMIYGVGEVPVKPALGVPFLRVDRGPEDLFDPETMGSFIGAPITYDHPAVDVTPDNWNQLAKGYIMSVRRGEDENHDCIVADLLVTDKWLMGQIDAGKREVSLGYDASYQTVAPGFGRQFAIRGNHIALVERGRCGPRCAIGDSADSDPIHQPSDKEPHMGKRVQMLEEARARVRELEAEETAGAEDGIHIHVHTTDKAAVKAGEVDDDADEKTATLDKAVDERFTKIETTVAGFGETLKAIQAAVTAKPPKEGEEEEQRAGTGDSAALETGYQEFVAQAEILVPGFRVPTFDSAAPRKATVDGMCMGRRSVLLAAYATKDGKALIDSITGKKDLDLSGVGCADVAVTFKAASATKAAMNNRTATGDSQRLPDSQQAVKKAPTIAELNAAAETFWNARKASA